jgi:hypothetical protein
MGACDFVTRSRGNTAEEAFHSAVDRARHEHGHGGYTGTIAEKHSFTVLNVAAEKARLLGRLRGRLAEPGAAPWLAESVRLIEAGDVGAMADAMLSLGDPRVERKWGPAGCFAAGPEEWLFFGVASS